MEERPGTQIWLNKSAATSPHMQNSRTFHKRTHTSYEDLLQLQDSVKVNVEYFYAKYILTQWPLLVTDSTPYSYFKV